MVADKAVRAVVEHGRLECYSDTHCHFGLNFPVNIQWAYLAKTD